jgi:hypothetical protein
VYPANPGALTPALETASVQQTATQPMTFSAISDNKPVTLIPVSRAAHEYYSVYWQTDLRRLRGYPRTRFYKAFSTLLSTAHYSLMPDISCPDCAPSARRVPGERASSALGRVMLLQRRVFNILLQTRR